MSEVKFALYVSSVEGHVVPRFPSVKMGKRPNLIGATRDFKDPSKITWDTDRIVGIPEAEYVRYRREYNRELSGGGLKKRKAEEYEAWVSAQVKAHEVKAEQAKAAQAQKQQPVDAGSEVVS